MTVTFRENDEDLDNFLEIEKSLGIKTKTGIIRLGIKCLANIVRVGQDEKFKEKTK